MMDLKDDHNASTMDKRKDETNSVNEYEPMLQKLEEETRDHIRVEQQLKLHIDNLQEKIEEIERTSTELREKVNKKEEICQSLKESLKVAELRCDELKGKIEMFEKAATPFSTNIEQSHSQISICVEEKAYKPHVDVSKIRSVGDFAKRVVVFINRIEQ